MNIEDLVLEDAVPKRGSPSKLDLYNYSRELGLPATQRMTKRELVILLQGGLSDPEQYAYCQGQRAYRYDQGQIIPIDIQELAPKHPCFLEVPHCSTQCEKMLDQSRYPCRSKWTIFHDRNERLEYYDMKQARKKVPRAPALPFQGKESTGRRVKFA